MYTLSLAFWWEKTHPFYCVFGEKGTLDVGTPAITYGVPPPGMQYYSNLGQLPPTKNPPLNLVITWWQLWYRDQQPRASSLLVEYQYRIFYISNKPYVRSIHWGWHKCISHMYCCWTHDNPFWNITEIETWWYHEFFFWHEWLADGRVTFRGTVLQFTMITSKHEANAKQNKIIFCR